jgi:hypothetical protein
MTTVLCDDVRPEEGNKLSYMGIYRETLLVPAFPMTLPKLCFVMSVISPASEPLPQSLIFRLFRNEEILSEMSLEMSTIKPPGASTPDDAEGMRRSFGTVLQLFPFQLTEACTLRARAYWGAEEIKGGSWPVRLQQSAS